MDIIKHPYKEDNILEKTFRVYSSNKDYHCDNGKVFMNPRNITVGKEYDFLARYEPAHKINKGGKVKFSFPRIWSAPQKLSPGEFGYTECFIGDKIYRNIELSHAKNLEWYVTVTLSARIEQHTPVFLKYKRVKIQRFPQDKWENWRNNLSVFVDRLGNDKWLPVAPENKFNLPSIKADRFFGIKITIPSITMTNRPYRAKLSFVDKFNNPCRPRFTGKIQLIHESSGEKITTIKLEKPSNHFEINSVKFHEGIRRISAVYRGKSFDSNYTVCRKHKSRNLYFGDIHAKTEISDGLGTSNEYFSYAKYIAHDDFSAITDHNHRECSSVYEPWVKKMPGKAFKKIKKAVKDWNKPQGGFVTLLGIEEPLPGFGHRNVYFKKGASKLFKGSSPRELYVFLKENEKEAMVIPHHTLELCKSCDYDPEYTTLIEIYSMWGSSEQKNGFLWNKGESGGKSVQELLNNGYKFGFVGGSDNHHGQPSFGSTPSRFSNLGYRGGLTAVYSDGLSRSKIYESLKNRCCYATTGERIILSFSINGKNMGETLVIGEHEIPFLKVFALGTKPLRKIEIIKNGETAFRFECGGSSEEEEITYEDAKFQGSAYYYARVYQKDCNIAWSSPIWVKTKETKE